MGLQSNDVQRLCEFQLSFVSMILTGETSRLPWGQVMINHGVEYTFKSSHVVSSADSTGMGIRDPKDFFSKIVLTPKDPHEFYARHNMT